MHKKLLIVALVVALVASVSMIAVADEEDYSLTTPTITVDRTTTYSWSLDTELVPNEEELDTGAEFEGYFAITAERSVESDVLSVGLEDFDLEATEEAAGADKESMTIVFEALVDGDWEAIATVDFDLNDTIGVGDDLSDPLDEEFLLDLTELDDYDDLAALLDDADELRLAVAVNLDEDGDEFTLAEEYEFDFNEVTEVNAEAEIETNLYDQLTAEFDDVTITDEDEDAVNDSNDDDWTADGEVNAVSFLINITSADDDYVAEIETTLTFNEEDDPLSETDYLTLTFGTVDEEEEEEEEDWREGWEDGLHPVHGFWMPPVKDGFVLGNGAVPVKFWMPSGAEDVQLLIVRLDDEDDFDADDFDLDDVLDVDEEEDGVGAVALNGKGDEVGMYKYVLKNKDLNLEAGEYMLVVTFGDEIATFGNDPEDAVLHFTVEEPKGKGNSWKFQSNDDDDDFGPANVPGKGRSKKK